ncbi:Fungal transcriptional regulatory protein, N-terminal [Pleurostoma richardsiae]|uniref:Fungal transcriptional regulatory protein, N-terminal n=1 Tax=Pleurostoma richardsiae TaxID=41990 RepID=A0AA38RY38_9PEZI|nr:Fungal transcriptional regulatory protein, N-terminal [Pleurostoma richardsiae]
MELESGASAAPGAGSPAKPRKKRTKTGCRRCRIRRRKCDEAKPRCTRCADRNLECQYPSGVTFLEKNIFTAELSGAPTAAAPKYHRLQFVDAKSPTAGSTKPDSPSQHSRDGGAPVDIDEYPTVTGLLAGMDGASPGMEIDVTDQAIDSMGWDPSVGMEVIPGEDVPGTTASDGFETALQVLLSLNADPVGASTSADIQTPVIRERGNSISPGQAENAVADESLSAVVASRRKGEPQAVIQHANLAAGDISGETIVCLVRHYRYRLAPWLDICDVREFFGTIVPGMTSSSVAIHQALLALSAASLDARALARESQAPRSPFGLWQDEVICGGNCIAGLLLAVRAFISSAPTAWRSVWENSGYASLASHYSGQECAQYLSWLHLRLDLSVALVAGTTVSLKRLPIVQPILRWDPSDLADSMFQYANKALLLCAQAINFCSQDPARTALDHDLDLGPRLTLAQQWRLIADDLNAWYGIRPHEFQPMVELDLSSHGTESLFPTILFTNGAAVMGNQMYHTAMMLMLEHKPRTLVLDDRGSPAWSHLWHAQRVCGIALNNDRRECWDLALVASFYVAAKGMTYEPQQREILRCFDGISRLAGWNIGQFRAMLRHSWDMPDTGS